MSSLLAYRKEPEKYTPDGNEIHCRCLEEICNNNSFLVEIFSRVFFLKVHLLSIGGSRYSDFCYSVFFTLDGSVRLLEVEFLGA